MKKLNVLAFASAMLAVGAYGDFAAQSETFESPVDEQYATWVGDGYSKTETIASYEAGRPGGITGTSTYVLSVEGSVTNGSLFAGMAASTASQVDMMVKIVWPDEALALPSGETDVQIAVGIDTLGRLNVYCAPKSGTGDAAFVPVSGELASNVWHRISFNFDYVNRFCEIALDGLPQVSEYGALSADATIIAGSWYKLANNATVLSSMKVVGTTAIDDVYTSQVTSGNPINIPDSAVVSDSASGGTGAAVKKSWLVAQGVADVTAAAPDGTGMTVAQKYVAGLDVNDGIKFELKDLQPSTSDATKMVFSFPGTTANGSTFELQGSDTPNGEYSTVTGTFTAGTAGANNTIAVDVSQLTGVKYFKVVASN